MKNTLREAMTLSPEVLNALWAMAGNVAIALLARILYHHRAVVDGKRRWWSAEFFWEFPMAVFMGVVGQSVASYVGMTGVYEAGVIGAVAYIGPRGAEHLLITIATRKVPVAVDGGRRDRGADKNDAV